MAKIKKLEKQKYKRDYSLDLKSQRRTTQVSLYGSPGWKRLRMAKLAETPLCERCSSLGAITLACEVHHKEKFLNGINEQEQALLFYDFFNLMSVCKPCHYVLDNKVRVYD
jgi:hypothetical protein